MDISSNDTNFWSSGFPLYQECSISRMFQNPPVSTVTPDYINSKIAPSRDLVIFGNSWNLWKGIDPWNKGASWYFPMEILEKRFYDLSRSWTSLLLWYFQSILASWILIQIGCLIRELNLNQWKPMNIVYSDVFITIWIV